MKTEYIITEGNDNKFYVSKILEVAGITTSKILSVHKNLQLAEDAVPAMSASSGNVAGISPGDEPVVRSKPLFMRRTLRQIVKKKVN